MGRRGRGDGNGGDSRREGGGIERGPDHALRGGVGRGPGRGFRGGLGRGLGHGAGLDRRRLRLLVGALFLGLALPAAFLIRQGFGQLELESFRQQQLLAEAAALRIDGALAQIVAVEDARPFADYFFEGQVRDLTDGGARGNAGGDARGTADAEARRTIDADARGNAVSGASRSPLSAFPPAGNLPGLIGYFQVDESGTLSTPLLPRDRTVESGLDESDRAARARIQARLLDILAENRLVRDRGVASAVAATLESGPGRGPQFAVRSERASAGFNESSAAEARAPAETGIVIPATAGSDADTPGLRQRPQASRDQAIAADDIRGQAAFDLLSSSQVPGTAQQAQAQAKADGQSSADAGGAAGGALEEAVVEAARSDVAAEPESPAPERTLAPEAGTGERADDAEADETSLRVAAFRSDVDPLQFSRLDTGHFVLYRNAWRDGERFVQGALIEPARFLETSLGGALDAAGLAAGTRVRVGSGGTELIELEPPGSSRPDSSSPNSSSPDSSRPGTRAEQAEPATAAPTDRGAGTARDAKPVYSMRLSPPLASLELAFFVDRLPLGAAWGVLVWTSVVLVAVLVGGLFAMYRFGVKQIDLARQQQNFVSAVSHELKTPLTSIRMYGEMLKSGWASDEKKQGYYDFIYAEGERLSRLIDNVLALARLDRGDPAAAVEPVGVGEIVDMLRSKVSTQAEQAGIELMVEVDEAVGAVDVAVDADAMAQVFINLIDNAIKFAAGAERREVVLAVRSDGGDRVVFSIRDFGPGIADEDMRRLFELFYRPDNERTRATSGTGIGLALVRQLVTAMGGRVDVRNRDPGAEFRVILPRASATG